MKKLLVASIMCAMFIASTSVSANDLQKFFPPYQQPSAPSNPIKTVSPYQPTYPSSPSKRV